MTPEGAVLRLCLDWLSLQRGVRVWRNNSGAFGGVHNGKRHFVRFGTKGQADITGVLSPQGRRIEIEVKAAKKKPTEDQESFLQAIRESGGIAFYADSLEMLEEKWKAAL